MFGAAHAVAERHAPAHLGPSPSPTRAAGRPRRARSPGTSRAGGGRARRTAGRARRRRRSGWAPARGCGRCRTSWSTSRASRARARRRAAPTMRSRSASVAARSQASRPMAKPRSALCAVYANGVTVVGVREATAWYSDHVLQPHGHALDRQREGQLLDEAEQVGDVRADVVAHRREPEPAVAHDRSWSSRSSAAGRAWGPRTSRGRSACAGRSSPGVTSAPGGVDDGLARRAARPGPTSAIRPSRTRTSPRRARAAGAVDDGAAVHQQIGHVLPQLIRRSWSTAGRNEHTFSHRSAAATCSGRRVPSTRRRRCRACLDARSGVRPSGRRSSRRSSPTGRPTPARRPCRDRRVGATPTSIAITSSRSPGESVIAVAARGATAAVETRREPTGHAFGRPA